MSAKRGNRSAGKLVTGVVLAAACGAAWAAYTGFRPATDHGPSLLDSSTAIASTPSAITALGRLEPKDGVRNIAGPSRSGAVIGKLLIDEGVEVLAGEVIAVLDDFAVLEGRAEGLRVRLANAETELRRHEELYRKHSISASQRDSWRMQVDTIKAELRSADAELELAMVRTPISGRVLKVHARSGERVPPQGIAEIGQTDEMYAIAEVYETDITRVHVGQRANVTTPALAAPVHGTVEQVGLKVIRQAMMDTDPDVQTDARVVEVKIRLDDSTSVAGLTDLRTEVVIEP